MKKIKVLIICGGQSAEHEVSLKSAYNVASAIDKAKYTISFLAIDKTGHWFPIDQKKFLQSKPPKSLEAFKIKKKVLASDSGNQLIPIGQKIKEQTVVFPVLHGPYGEDGTIQGLLKLANLPFVGADVLGSAVGMDKDVMKRLLREAKVLTANFQVFTEKERHSINFTKLKNKLGLPFYIKPANLGSSVGISRVSKENELKKALDLAFQFDRKIIFEANIFGREIECSVLGNDQPIASLPGEVIVKSKHQFYSYDAKYLDENGAELVIPAKLPMATIKKIQDLAIKTFQILCCSGLARVDFFLDNNKIYINEINTIPGFTNISMYPKLWEASGLSYSDLIDRLIQLALERYYYEKK